MHRKQPHTCRFIGRRDSIDPDEPMVDIIMNVKTLIDNRWSNVILLRPEHAHQDTRQAVKWFFGCMCVYICVCVSGCVYPVASARRYVLMSPPCKVIFIHQVPCARFEKASGESSQSWIDSLLWPMCDTSHLTNSFWWMSHARVSNTLCRTLGMEYM